MDGLKDKVYNRADDQGEYRQGPQNQRSSAISKIDPPP